MSMMFSPVTHEEKMAQARHVALQKAPYYSSAIYKFTFVGEEELSGAMTLSTGMVLRYLIPWALEASIDELAADIAHECWHLLSDHFGRWEDILPQLITKTGIDAATLMKLCNYAGDLAGNPPLKTAGWKICDKGKYRAIFPADFGLPDGLAMEEYLQKLIQQAKQEGGSPPKPKGGGGEGIASGNCGSIARGKEEEGDARGEELEKRYGKSAIDRQAVVMQVMEDVKNHVAVHGRGSVPGQLVEWITVMDIPSVVPWQEEVALFTSESVGQVQAGAADFSITRPSKRSYTRGMVRPGLIEYEPVVALVLDSSGSMGHEQLKSGCREFAAVLEQLGITEVWFAEADCGVAMEWRKVGIDFLQNPEIRGRGGTDFRPAIHSARKLDPKPDVLIYATDGDGAAPKHPPPDMNVIWLLVPGPWTRVPVKWGKVIIMEEDPKVKTELLKTAGAYDAYAEEDDPYEEIE